MDSNSKPAVKSAVYYALVIQSLVSAGTYIFAKGAIYELAPLVFGFYRFMLASVILFAAMVFRKRYFPYGKSEWPLVILLSILAIPINQGFFLVGLLYTSPTHAALLYATTPIWVYLISVFKKEESFTKKKSWGIFVAMIGVLAFFLEKGIKMQSGYIIGDSLMMIAVWAWAAYTVLGRPIAKSHGAITVTASALVLGTIIFLPLGLFMALRFDYSHVTMIGWGGVAYTAIITSVFAYTIWYWIIKHIEPAKAAVFMNLQPVFTAVMAYFILKERLTLESIAAGIVILLGVYITQKD